MIGATRRHAARAAVLWEPLGQVIEAIGTWQPTEDAFRVRHADSSRRGDRAVALAKPDEAGLLNAVLYASLLPRRSDLEAGDAPYLVPLFVPQRYARGAVRGEEVLALSVTIDGTPLGELDGLPVLRRGATDRQVVRLTVSSSREKRLEDGCVTVSVGFGPGPASVASWADDAGRERVVVVRGAADLPADAPAWMRHALFGPAVAPLGQRELSLCYAVTSDLGRRATARLLAQFRPLLAGRMRYHAVANEENVRNGGTMCTEEDRRNDLYECLLLHVRNFVAKALREDGEYRRDLFAYVTGCFKPAAARALLAYGPKTGHQDHTGESAKVSELVGTLRQHAAIYRLTDPAAARAHHAVHWILARRLRDELASGELTIDDLWAMWTSGDLPRGVKVPDVAAWDAAIAHQAAHVPFDAPADGLDDVTGDIVQLPGASSHARTTSKHTLADDELDLLTEPTHDAGFFAITSRVARQLAAEQPDEWAQALGEGRAARRLVRKVLEPFGVDDSPSDAAERLYDSCTNGARWRTGDDLMAAWRRGGARQDDAS